VEGFMNVCLPFFTLESVMDKLNTKYWYANMQEQNDESFGGHIEDLIKRVDVPVKAVLGKTNISVTDFVNLQVGDIIRLNTEVEQDLKVYVGNIKKFTALPGSSRDKYAVRVTSVIREGE
jgi:flagellar motor switch protein FliM